MTGIDRREFMARTAGTVSLVGLLSPAALASSLMQAGGLRVGIVGMGRQGRAVASQLQKFEGLTIAALCDIDERRLAAGERRVGEVAKFDDYRKMLDEAPLDAVMVCTPTHTHRRIALDAYEAGRHVYCEAPLAHTVEDCAAIAQGTRGGTGVFAAGLAGRSNPVYSLARSFFLSDAVRDVVTMRAQHHRKTSWRTPARDPVREKALNWRLDPEVSIGLAGEWGVHQYDVFHWFRGTYPVRVRGGGSIRLHDDGRVIDDTIHTTLEWEDGTALQYSATLANSYGGAFETLYGTNAAIKLAWTHGWMFKEADAPTQGWEVYANRQQFHNDEGITLIADATKLASQGKLKEGVGLPHPPLYYAIADFLKSVTEGSGVACGADEAARATAVAIAASEAVTRGSEVAIDLDALKG